MHVKNPMPELPQTLQKAGGCVVTAAIRNNDQNCFEGRGSARGPPTPPVQIRKEGRNCAPFLPHPTLRTIPPPTRDPDRSSTCFLEQVHQKALKKNTPRFRPATPPPPLTKNAFPETSEPHTYENSTEH